MSHYVYFKPEQKEQAHMTNLEDLLRREGETLKRSGSEWEWRDGSQKVTIRGNEWFHQYDQVGGDAISFVQRFYNKSFPEAVEYLLGKDCGVITHTPTRQKNPKQKTFVLPAKNDNMRRAYAYLLSQRKLDREVVNAFARKGMIYESQDYHNVVFVGYDQNGVPRHAQKRGTGSQSTYKGNTDGSMLEYSFHWHGTSDYLFLFEAPIDMLSYITMAKDGWTDHSYAAACSVCDKVLFQMFKDNPNIKYVFICFDNDEAGQSAARKLTDKLSAMGIPGSVLVPTAKDWNEDLVDYRNETEEASCMQQVM